MSSSTVRLAAAAGLLAVSAAAGRAVEYTWNGGGTTGNWSEAANWGGTAPASDLTNTLIRLAGPTNTATVLDAGLSTSGNPPAFELHRLTFAADSGPFTITQGVGGPPLRMGGASGGGGITVESGNASNLAINAPLTLSGGGSFTWTHNGTGLLTVSGPVMLSGPGVLVGGTGDYAITGAISSVPANNGITFTGAGTKTLSGANTYTGFTNIPAGTVKLAGGANRLPTGTTVRLGGATGPSIGTLDLNGQSQSVFGLMTLNLDANNRVLSTAAGAFPTFTVNNTSSNQTFNGTLGGAGGDDFSFRVITGTSNAFTLTQANTYTGDTTITGTLKLSGSGSIANSRTITVGPASPGASMLDVSTTGTNPLTGGANFDATTGRFALAAGQRLQGFGRGTIGGVTVRAGSAVQGGVDSAIGTFTVGGSSTVNAATGTDGGTIRVYVRDTGTVTASRIAISGVGSTLDFANIVPGQSRFQIDLRDAGGLQMGKSYSITLATAGGFLRNGIAASFTTDDFILTSPDFPSFTGVSLVNAGAELMLNFTPVPEPATVLAVAGLGLAGLGRARRWFRPAL
ncbi:MAG TPA: PEP-CTERM sorting domain-containing protein [Fimbriiglobus sp.]|nr:PEP-CTERM sorting domain-containing protein [Fimbriiglobus sp.]